MNPSPEVIEFPAVLYDAKNRTVPDDPLSVFHGYVMPTEEPILSKFCTELTGINQDQVNSGNEESHLVISHICNVICLGVLTYHFNKRLHLPVNSL
jgi:inhibitor of KinA sporulation pathway (predicted exonuclease)